jgi:hypothetical protein
MKEFWGGFIELELKVENLAKVVHFAFNYMPSSIEILDQKEIKVKAIDFAGAMNDMLAKLHQYNIALNNAQSQLAKYQPKEAKKA